MKKTLVSLILMAMAVTATAQTIGEAFYIYRNDGRLNAFFREQVDSIVYSCYDEDSILYDDAVMQVVYTADSIYRIPIEAIDSVGFVTPKTIYQPGVKVIDELAQYVLSSDSLSFVLSSTTPNSLVPKAGDKIVTNEYSEGFPNGFFGEVVSVTNSNGGIMVNCSRVALTDIYEVFYGCSQTANYSGSGASSRIKRWQTGGEVTIRPGRASLGIHETISGQYQLLDNVVLNFTPELTIEIEPTWTVNGFVIITPQTGIYATALCIGDYQLEERLGLSGSLQFQKDFPIPVISHDHIPIVPPYLFFYDHIGGFIQADFTASARWEWNQHYRQVLLFEYDSRGENLLRRAPNEPRLIGSSHSDEGLLNGSVSIGAFADMGVTLVDRAIDKACVRGEYGLTAEAQAVLYRNDYEDANRSTALYEQMRNCGFSLSRFWNLSLQLAAGPWGVSWTPLHNRTELWKCRYLPQFNNVEATRSDKKTKATGRMTASGRTFQDVGVGLALMDEEENLMASGFATYSKSGESVDYHYEFSGLKPGKKYTMYPTVKTWDYTLLATPTYELDADLPVKITDFKQTGSQYKKDGFSHDGRTYSYKYDVAVTVELSDNEGVEDWGYVYLDPYGNVAHISLKNYGTRYTDTRYVYYRNESKSTVTLYEYVKYQGEQDYVYGEPKDYEVSHSLTYCPDNHHPHMIDLGLPSGTKWSCCNEGASKPEDYGGYYQFGAVSTAPSLDQIKELLNNCSYSWTQMNGVRGGQFTGPNGGTIFLPAAGYVWYGELDDVGSGGYYWSSTPNDEYNACRLGFSSLDADWYNGGWHNYRTTELSVRPVR